MAVFYQGNRVRFFIPGLKEGENINLDPATFRPEMLPKREIRMDKDHTLLPIPVLPGRIRTRKDGYVELILESHYDKEAGQSRNKKVVIGRDDSDFLPGMMSPNDNYYNLFDSHGRLFDDPMKPPEADRQTEAAENQSSVPRTPEPQQTTPQHTVPTRQPETAAQPNPPKPEGKPTDNTKEQELLKRDRELTEREIQLSQRERELDAWQKQLEEREVDLYFQTEDTEKDHIKLLSYILDSYRETIEHQARKKPDAPMTPKQIRTINEILSELKAFFTGCETDGLLHLAEEPDPAAGIPGTTNGEMALLLSAYQFTINAYRYNELRNK